MAITLKTLISCEAWDLKSLVDDACFEHAMNKVAQYATRDNKVSIGLKLINTKYAQPSFQFCITWLTKIVLFKIENHFFCNKNLSKILHEC
jgi:hypothetical protein